MGLKSNVVVDTLTQRISLSVKPLLLLQKIHWYVLHGGGDSWKKMEEDASIGQGIISHLLHLDQLKYSLAKAHGNCSFLSP